MNKTKILISSCLLGSNCKYNGSNNYNESIKLAFKDYQLIPICPEVFGGLSTPRNPSEIKNDKVISSTGDDVTEYFLKGARLSLYLAKENHIMYAILKQKSPSCGRGKIYDGTFSNNVIKGNGITTKLLEDNGIMVFTEEDYDVLLDILNKSN